MINVIKALEQDKGLEGDMKDYRVLQMLSLGQEQHTSTGRLTQGETSFDISPSCVGHCPRLTNESRAIGAGPALHRAQPWGKARSRRCKFALSPPSERLWASLLGLQTSDLVCFPRGGNRTWVTLRAAAGSRAAGRECSAPRAPQNFVPNVEREPRSAGGGGSSGCGSAATALLLSPRHGGRSALSHPRPRESKSLAGRAAELAKGEEAGASRRRRRRRGSSRGAGIPERSSRPPPGWPLQPRGPRVRGSPAPFQSLIKQIPRILGPGLKKAGKFPSLLTHNEDMVAKVDEMKSRIKCQMKKVLCLAVALGPVKMTEDELVYNIHLAVSFLASLLKRNWQNIWALCIKSTMGKPQHLHEGTQLNKP
ncbi:uncharacterized protein [Callorhinus ursinus]|uniref:Uncharacterized protein LOC112839655 n=1 Tax=Callorhinus ursinus TaxID=34884 RepID=A0A3Q7QRM7_CALUR|nr:uncharacterized protein LOC112839655 [Callorhinus ursinus]